jgi:hypothetical protein
VHVTKYIKEFLYVKHYEGISQGKNRGKKSQNTIWAKEKARSK